MKRKISLLVMVIFILVSIAPISALSLTDTGLKVGAWLGVQPSTGEITNMQTLQGRKLDVVNFYVDWNTEFSSITGYLNPIYNNGSIGMITWEAWGFGNPDVNNGSKDAYITRMASSIKSYGKEIWIALFHEGNGNWYPWAIGDSTVNTNDTYKAAYQRVVNIFRQQGATNAKFIFNVNCDSCGANTSYLGHYPGDTYVDYVAMDGYNWGTTQSWGSVWKTFDQIFSTAYSSLSTINKPIVIDEFASTEVGGNKAQWITDAFSTLQASYPRVKAVLWFNQNKETDWRINSSQAALDAYKAAINTSSTPTPTPSTATATPTPTPTVTATPTPGTATPTPSTATPTPTPGTATPTPTPGTATPTPTLSTATATPTPTPTAGTPVPGGIKVQFFNGNTATATNTIYTNFKVVNTGAASVNLSDVKVRYYFTNDGTQADSFACDYSTVGSGNITGSFTTIAKANADRYLEVGFTSSAGTLAAGTGAEIKGRVWKSDWSNFTQTNDYSFNATATNYVDSTTVTGYMAGSLKWGTEP